MGKTAAKIGLVLALTLCARPAATEKEDRFPGGLPQTPIEELPSLERRLKTGDWNSRINAVHRLGALGEEAIPTLRAAARDADWQVRFTAVHWLGRLGSPSIPALREVLQDDPCRVIRIAAVHWLGSIGGDGLTAVAFAAEDESGVARLTSWYWMRKRGLIDKDAPPPPESPEEDLNICVNSRFAVGRDVRDQLEIAALRGEDGIIMVRRPGPAPKPSSGLPPTKAHSGPPAGPADFSGPVEDMPEREIALRALARREEALKKPKKERLPRPAAPVKKPGSRPPAPPPPAVDERDRLLEIDTIFPFEKGDLPMPESPPSGEPSRVTAEPVREEPGRPPPEFDLLVTEAIHGMPEGSLPRPKTPKSREPAKITAVAELAEDQGRPSFHDALSDLLKIIEEGDSKLRSRAVDEIGRMGPRAVVALPVLRRTLKDKDPRVRSSSALAIGKFGEAADPAVPDLIRALRDKNVDVRYCAAHSLARVGTRRAQRAFERYMAAELRRSMKRMRNASR